jgi:hypothetical protein
MAVKVSTSSGDVIVICDQILTESEVSTASSQLSELLTSLTADASRELQSMKIKIGTALRCAHELMVTIVTLTEIQRAFGAAWHGNNRPTMIVANLETMGKVATLLAENFLAKSENWTELQPLPIIAFPKYSGADMMVCADIPNGSVLLFNENHFNDPNLNCLLKVQ